MKRREFNERLQSRRTTRILTNSRVFRHARVLVIYKESLPGLLARLFSVRQISTASSRKARARERHLRPANFRTCSMRSRILAVRDLHGADFHVAHEIRQQQKRSYDDRADHDNRSDRLSFHRLHLNCGNHGIGHHVANTANPLRTDIFQRVIAGVVSLFDV